jgi:hypothetical protein
LLSWFSFALRHGLYKFISLCKKNY